MLRVLRMTRCSAGLQACHVVRRRTGVLVAALALSVMATACASSGATPRPFPTPDRSTAAPSPGGETAPLANETPLISTALSFRGVPYRNGGSDPNGFDCSGFTQYVFAQHGIALPRETREQFEVGEKIKQKDIQTGDLVFFHTVASGASHVGIALNDDEFVHAPSTAGVVRVEHLSSAYWSKRFIAAKRVTPVELAARPLPFPGAPRVSRSTD
jgi:cell wall-associated NlpC family hydrolase